MNKSDAPSVAQPLQPLYTDDEGVVRFWHNAIVNAVLDAARAGRKLDLNDIAIMEFSAADRKQFAQLIGYSLSGFGDLSYVTDAAYKRAEHALYGLGGNK